MASDYYFQVIIIPIGYLSKYPPKLPLKGIFIYQVICL